MLLDGDLQNLCQSSTKKASSEVKLAVSNFISHMTKLTVVQCLIDTKDQPQKYSFTSFAPLCA